MRQIRPNGNAVDHLLQGIGLLSAPCRHRRPNHLSGRAAVTLLVGAVVIDERSGECTSNRGFMSMTQGVTGLLRILSITKKLKKTSWFIHSRKMAFAEKQSIPLPAKKHGGCLRF